MLRSITLDIDDFFKKLKTGEYSFIAYENCFGTGDFNIPTRLLSDDIPENNLIEITSHVDDIKLTYYLPIDMKKYLCLNAIDIDYEKKIISFIEIALHSRINESVSKLFEGPVKLYYYVSLLDWKNAIMMAYNMVINHNGNDLYFTYDDVYKNMCGRNNDMGDNITKGVNIMLKASTMKQISLSGCNRGSHVTID